MKHHLVLTSLLASLLLSPATQAATEGGVTIDVERVFTGTATGTRYYGYSGGRITLPHDRGGMLAFNLWNDMETGGMSRTNILNASVGGARIRIVNYATRNQLREEYTDCVGSWGPAGVGRHTLAIPPGVASITFDNGGSETGIELSELQFTDGYRALPGGCERSDQRPYGEPLIQVGRVFKGIKSGRQYFGYDGGVIHLPHGNGGYLSFKIYNDQPAGFRALVNRINLDVGGQKETFAQYSTSMDLEETYAETPDQWGPAGGSTLSIQIPEGVTRVNFNNSGSETGIEIADVVFTKGPPAVFDYRERLNRGTAVLKEFGRVFRGASTGREFFGYDGGRVALPNNKGGVLTFRIWNDQNRNTPKTANRLNIRAGALELTEPLSTTTEEITEFYTDTPDQWGPAGGRTVQITVPSGTGIVEFNNAGSETGVELSDFTFRSN